MGPACPRRACEKRDCHRRPHTSVFPRVTPHIGSVPSHWPLGRRLPAAPPAQSQPVHAPSQSRPRLCPDRRRYVHGPRPLHSSVRHNRRPPRRTGCSALSCCCSAPRPSDVLPAVSPFHPRAVPISFHLARSHRPTRFSPATPDCLLPRPLPSRRALPSPTRPRNIRLLAGRRRRVAPTCAVAHPSPVQIDLE